MSSPLNPYESPSESPEVPVAPLRESVSGIMWNGVFWAIGNALTTGNFILYLARDLGAEGLGLALLLALPNLAGVLRLFAPWIVRLAGDAKRSYFVVTLIAYLILLVGLPLVDLRFASENPTTVVALIGLIFVHQAFEYVGQVVLWAWYGDLVPGRIRGRIFGRRQAWQLVAVIPLTWASGWFIDASPELFGEKTFGYLIVHVLGITFLLLSLQPLWSLPGPRRPPALTSLAETFLPFRDPQYRSFLLFRGWLSFANGITQSAQFLWTKDVLGITLLQANIVRTYMQVGQALVSNSIGRDLDARGYRKSLTVAQLVVTIGLAAFLFAEPKQPDAWVYIGYGFFCWSAYAVHNIALPNLALKFAPPDARAGYTAAYEALGSATHAAATIGAGLLLDMFRAEYSLQTVCFGFLCAGVAARAAAIPLAAIIREPQRFT